MNLSRVHDCIGSSFPRHLETTQAFLRQRSESHDKGGLSKAANWLANHIRGMGGQVELVEGQEAPILVARFDAGAAKTLLVYSMYDVHPAEGQAWSSPPFAADIRVLPDLGPSIVARGACNSKGPLMGFLNAVHAMRQVDQLPVNLLLTIEGEEEIGSPSLSAYYRENSHALKADAAFEPFWAEYGTDTDAPTIFLGTKGILSLELSCHGGPWGGPADYPVHSSVGAWLASPRWRLIRALGTLVDADQEIKIDGLRDEITPPDAEDEALLAGLAATLYEARTLRLMGAERYRRPLHGTDLLREYYFSPTMHVGNLSQADGDTIAPEAWAELTIRLVPGMTLETTVSALRAHLAKMGYADIGVSVLSGYPGARTSIREQVVQSLLDAYRYHGVEPQIVPLATSATPWYLFDSVLGIPFVWGGLGRAGRSHSSDEYATVEGMRLFEESIATFLYRYAGLSL